jgi:hypothetical protein
MDQQQTATPAIFLQEKGTFRKRDQHSNSYMIALGKGKEGHKETSHESLRSINVVLRISLPSLYNIDLP